MKVQLISHTKTPELIVAMAGRICYSSKTGSELYQDLNEEKVSKMIKKLIDSGHYSVLEHANYTFLIEGVSRTLLAQLTRHRICSFSVRSQRYVDEKNFDFVIPKPIQNNDEMKKYKEIMNNIKDNYEQLRKLGLHQEDARYVLPNATETQLITTFNARSLFNFFGLRCCKRSQWEIRELANKMRSEVYKTSPLIFEKAGANCLQLGYCPEGDKSCSPHLTNKK